MKLHLGCGHDYEKGYINCDISKKVKSDKIVDLEKKLPFKDNSIKEVIANHVFEHIINFIDMMHELHRICKKNSIIKIKVPFYNSSEQATDPTHVRSFSPFTFDYFNINSNISKYSHEVGAEKNMFKIKKVKINYALGRTSKLNYLFNPLINLSHSFYCKFLAGILPASEIEFELVVVK